EVDEHHVLGALLRVGLELGLESRVLRRRGAALPGASDGAHGDGLAGEADEELGGAAGEGAVPEAEEEEVGGGGDAAERPVEVEGVSSVVGREPPGEHDLVAVSGGDVLAGASDGGLEA